MSQARNVLKEAGKLSVVNNRLVVESLTAASTLDALDSGKVFMLNLAGGFTTTLPLPQSVGSGWSASFLVSTAPTTSYILSTGTTSIYAVGVSSQDAAGDAQSSAGTADTNINFVGSQALVGDRVDIFTDGVAYYATFICDEIADITLT